MIGWLQGQLADRWQQNSRWGVLLVCGGVGYELQITRRLWDQLDAAATPLSLHVHQVIRDDGWTLYGFIARAERDLFRELVAVSGVGPQMAMGLLGQLSDSELVRAIVQADLRLLCQAPGVGKRTAERLAVELRSRLQERYAAVLAPAIEDSALDSLSEAPPADVRDDVQLTLAALGYEALEINRALRVVGRQPGFRDEPAEAWLRESLRWLSRPAA